MSLPTKYINQVQLGDELQEIVARYLAVYDGSGNLSDAKTWEDIQQYASEVFQFIKCTDASNTPKDVTWTTSTGSTITGALEADNVVNPAIYFVPISFATPQECDLYIAVGAVGSRVWETVDISKYAKKGTYTTSIEPNHTHSLTDAEVTVEQPTPKKKNLAIGRSTDVSLTQSTTDVLGPSTQFTTTVLPEKKNIKATASVPTVTPTTKTISTIKTSSSSQGKYLVKGKIQGIIAAREDELPTRTIAESRSLAMITGESTMVYGTANVGPEIRMHNTTAGEAVEVAKVGPAVSPLATVAPGAAVTSQATNTFMYNAEVNNDSDGKGVLSFTFAPIATTTMDIIPAVANGSIQPAVQVEDTLFNCATQSISTIPRYTFQTETVGVVVSNAEVDAMAMPGEDYYFATGAVTSSEVSGGTKILTANDIESVEVLDSVAVEAPSVVLAEATSGAAGSISVATDIQSATTTPTASTVSVVSNVGIGNQPDFALNGDAASGIEYVYDVELTSQTVPITGTIAPAGEHSHTVDL